MTIQYGSRPFLLNVSPLIVAVSIYILTFADAIREFLIKKPCLRATVEQVLCCARKGPSARAFSHLILCPICMQIGWRYDFQSDFPCYINRGRSSTNLIAGGATGLSGGKKENNWGKKKKCYYFCL
jgi:hypothetical protein